MEQLTPVSSSRLRASEATKVIVFPLAAPQRASVSPSQLSDFPRPLGAARPITHDIDGHDELIADVAAAVLVLRRAQLGYVTPAEAIEAALIRLGGEL